MYLHIVCCVFGTLPFTLPLLTTAFEIPVIKLTGGLDVAAMTPNKIYHRSAYIIPTRSRCHRFVVSERWSICFSQMRDLSGADNPIDALRGKLRKAEERAARERARADRECARAAEQRAEAAEQRARADRESARAAEQRAEAAEQRARAAEQRARADRESAEAAEQRAEAAEQRARADEQEDIANLMKGKRWVIFSDLEQANENISDSTSFCLGNGYAHPYLESLRTILGDTKLVSKTLLRSSVGTFFATDVFGTVRSSQHDLAHCVPHSRLLSEIWNPVIESMLGQSLFYNSKNNKNRYLHSCLTHQPYNYIAMRLQGTFFDTKCSVAFCPDLTCVEMASSGVWEKGYCALCIASDAEVYKAIGAVDGEILECTADDPRVARALKGFRDMSAILINIARSQLAVSSDKNDLKLAQALRDFFARQQAFVAPFPSRDSRAKYRLIRFSEAVAVPPGSNMAGDFQAVGHPAPMPIALVTKSLNSWLSFLLRTDSKLPGAFRGLKLPLQYKGSAGEGYCSLFPMCSLDDTLSCPTCLATLVSMMHPMFAGINYEEQSRASVMRVAELQEFVANVESHSVLLKAAQILAEAIDSKASLPCSFARARACTHTHTLRRSLALLVCAHAAALTARRLQNPDAAVLRKELLVSHRESLPFEAY